MHGKSNVSRGDVWAVNLDPSKGAEANKIRPCLVVTNNIANKHSPLITVTVITTTAPRKPYPFMVEVPSTANMPQQSWIHCGQIRTVDKGRFGRYYTSLDSDTMRKVGDALRVQLDLPAKGQKP
ncbi:MAG: type II toxin-antitoxin system PemK/MazF family toxin [Rubrobacter sp.]|nr:type II toxin-antitoxin system PemK/MazF family toxin [Rubrobacter sp.]